ncbi:MAG TPA: hypothetical protein ENJ04_02170 [Nitrospirae bacterium]|nr:hypothetical protein [Nitrospirota bacterium]
MGGVDNTDGMTGMLEYRYFAAVVVFTLFLVYAYYRGQRTNLRKIRETAASLENALGPTDKRYTWLGGVVGFSAEFSVEGFEEVRAVLTLVPRQSLLYMPIVLLRRTGDRLQLLFFLKEKPAAELHVIPKGRRLPHIHNMAGLERTVQRHGGLDVVLLHEGDPSGASRIAAALAGLLPSVRQISITPERSVFYVELLVTKLSAGRLEGFLRSLLDVIRSGGRAEQ